MGGNGSFISGITNFEDGRTYKTILSIGDNIKILETKNPRLALKLPEESHTPNRIYATFYRNGKGLKELAEYGADGKRLNSIHIIDHHGLGSHSQNKHLFPLLHPAFFRHNGLYMQVPDV